MVMRPSPTSLFPDQRYTAPTPAGSPSYDCFMPGSILPHWFHASHLWKSLICANTTPGGAAMVVARATRYSAGRVATTAATPAATTTSPIRSLTSIAGLPHPPVVRGHEAVPRAVLALHLRVEDPVTLALERDHVLILRDLAVACEARPLGAERQHLLRGIEPAVVDPERRHHRAHPRADERALCGIVAERDQHLREAATRHFAFALADHPEIAQRAHAFAPLAALGRLVGPHDAFALEGPLADQLL